jgi:hypothetical protein
MATDMALIVRLEISLRAETKRDAVYFLLNAVREAGVRQPGRAVEALSPNVAVDFIS